MLMRNQEATRNVFARAGISFICTIACMVALAAPAKAQDGLPVIVRGIPSASDSTELRLAYQASFPNGSFDPSIDKLNAGPMQPGDTGILNSNPTIEKRPGAFLVRISRPIGLEPELIPAESLWTSPVNFGPGSVSRIRATFIAPEGPLPGGGFAIGVNAKTGDKDDLSTDTRIAATVNVRPDFLVRFGVPFGSAVPARVVLPQDVKDAIFSTKDPQPFTIELTVDRVEGRGLAKLLVIGQVFSVPFVLSEFLADGGPTITAVGPGIAVNANAPGQTASVQVRDFRIYATTGE